MSGLRNTKQVVHKYGKGNITLYDSDKIDEYANEDEEELPQPLPIF
jgi:hypothetical protein